MKGLTSFVSDIRNCQSREAERKRVDKELAKIRVKFSNDQTLSGYDRKKYVWKLLYCLMLGYDVDFGHIQAVNLCSSPKYSEKLAGYLACSLLLADSTDVLRLIINIVKSDLHAKSDPIVALALHALANVGGPEFAENLFADVARLFVDESASVYVRKKASLCLLRLHRRDPDLLVPSEWAPNLELAIANNRNLGFLTSATSLMIGILETSESRVEWAECLRHCIVVLSQLVTQDCPGDYMYYSVAAPWLQVKLFRLLQFFPPATIDAAVLLRINDILARLVTGAAGAVAGSASNSAPSSATKLSRTKDSERLNRTNAENAIVFEAINVVVHLGDKVDREVRRSAASLLGSFVSAPEANTRYLGLEALARLADNAVRDDVIMAASEHKLFDKFKSLIASQLHETDVSVRRQALNLLYVICDRDNWQGIVDELLQVLANRDVLLEEELVLKIAILAEANAPDPTWYVDIVFKMFEYAPDSVGEQVWFRAVQVVVATEDAAVALHAARKAYEALGGSAGRQTYPHHAMMRLSIYIVGEFGYHLVNAKKVTSLRLVELLHAHFPHMSSRCRGICLTAYAKILNAAPTNKPLRDEVCMHIEALKDSSDPDLQQRSCELLYVIRNGGDALLEKVLAVIPPPSGGMKRNPLAQRLKMQTRSRAAPRHALDVKSAAPRVAESSSSESSGSSEDSD